MGRAVLLAAFLFIPRDCVAASREVRVLDEKGRAVAGAFVGCLGFAAGGVIDGRSPVAETGPDGRAALSETDFPCTAIASKQGYLPTLLTQVGRSPRAPGQGPLTLRLKRSAAAFGRVALQVSGLRSDQLYVGNLKSGPGLKPAAFALFRASATAGTLILENVPPAPPQTYLYSVFAPGASPQQGLIDGAVAAGGVSTVSVGPLPAHLTAPPPSPSPPPAPVRRSARPVVRGRVTDLYGIPLAKISYRLLLASGPETAVCASGLSDSEGRYEVSLGDPFVCEKKEYWFPAYFVLEQSAPHLGYEAAVSSNPMLIGFSTVPAQRDFVLLGNEPAPFPPGGREATLVGSLTDKAGVPLSGLNVEISVSSRADAQICQSVVSDDAGRYRAQLPAGFSCYDRRWRYPLTFFLTVSMGTPLDPRRLALTGGTPIPVEVAFASATVRQDWATGSASGGLDFEPVWGLPPGTSRTIRGSVADTEGRPLPGAEVVVRAVPDRRSIPCYRSTTERSGAYGVFVEKNAYCGGRPLQYPATFYVDLVPPPGFEYAHAPVPVWVKEAGAAAAVHWGPGSRPGAPRPRTQGEVCGTVEVLGRPAPTGFIHLGPDWRGWEGADGYGGGRPHPGPTKNHGERVRDGAFCVPQVAPGNYRLFYGPWLGARAGGEDPTQTVRLAHKGHGLAENFRFTIDDSGRTRIYDSAGALVLDNRPLLLESVLPVPQQDWGKVEFSLHFPDKADDATHSEPILFLVRLQRLPEAYFHWWTPASPSMKVPPGELYHVEALSNDWGVAQRSPDLELGGLAQADLWAAGVLRLDLDMEPVGAIVGKVRLPDGSLFQPSPYFEDPEPGRPISLLLWEAGNPRASVTLSVSGMDNEGRFEFAAAVRGLGTVFPLWYGNLPAWSFGSQSPPLVWVEAGKTAAVEIRLKERRDVRVPRGAVTLPPLPGPPFDRERWVIGLEAGSTDYHLLAPQFMHELQSFAMVVSHNDPSWPQPQNCNFLKDGVPTILTSPGVYDVYLVERMSPRYADLSKLGLTSVRVLALRKGFDVRTSPVTDLSFGPHYPAAAAGLRGSLKRSRWGGVSRLKAARTLAELDAMVTPRVDLYDARGRYAGSASAALSQEEHKTLGRGIDREDADALQRLLGSPREFAIAGLPAGRYTAKIVAYGYAGRELGVDLSESASPPLEIDLDAP